MAQVKGLILLSNVLVITRKHVLSQALAKNNVTSVISRNLAKHGNCLFSKRPILKGEGKQDWEERINNVKKTLSSYLRR